VAQAEEESMFTFDTTDQKEARRFRIAQFNGRVARSFRPSPGFRRASRDRYRWFAPSLKIFIEPIKL
jgi:hypothetical protein